MKDKKTPKKPGFAQGGNVQAKQKRYAHGGLVKTNQTTVKARGAGAATKGTNFKV
jgi:hypothetical protein